MNFISITMIFCTHRIHSEMVGVNSPKATVTFLPKESWYVPLISLSFCQALSTEDPRRHPNCRGHSGGKVASYQIIANKTLHQTDLRLTLGHVTGSAQLARIDPDTDCSF